MHDAHSLELLVVADRVDRIAFKLPGVPRLLAHWLHFGGRYFSQSLRNFLAGEAMDYKLLEFHQPSLSKRSGA